MTGWNIARIDSGTYLVALPARIVASGTGWEVPAGSAPLGNTEPVTGATVTQVRDTVAALAWSTIQKGALPVPVDQVAAVRLFSTVVTDHPRTGDMSGPVIQVPALADRSQTWWVATEGEAGVLAGHRQSGKTVHEAVAKLVEGLMLELAVNPQGVPENWSGIQLQLTSRKTYPVDVLAA